MSDVLATQSATNPLAVLIQHFTMLFGVVPDEASVAYYKDALERDPQAFAAILIDNSRAAVPIQADLQTANYCGSPVGFVHMMKTAGTSFTAALSEAVGVSPVVRSIGTDELPPQRSSIWPYIAGHSHIGAFPDGYRLVTVVREPRVRLLSLYASIHFHTSAQGDFTSEDLVDNSLKSVLDMDPNTWLMESASRELMACYFADHRLHQRLHNRLALEPSDFVAPLARLDAMAWAEDTFGMMRVIERVTGRRVEIPRYNVTHRPWQRNRPVSRDLLGAICAPDRMLVDVAVDIGLIPTRSAAADEAELEAQAVRLGFDLE